MQDPPGRRKTATIQSVVRALTILEAFGPTGGLTLREAAEASGVPRGTTYRMLETLVEAGYLSRSPDNNRYWMRSRALLLAAGFREEDWVTESAEPALAALAAQIQWPIRLITLEGMVMRVRAATDLQSPFAEPRVFTGSRYDLLRGTYGWVVLAFASKRRLQALLSSLDVTLDEIVHGRTLGSRLDQIRDEGFAYIGAPEFPYAAASVPVLAGRDCIGALNMGFYRRAIAQDALRDHYVPLLAGAAHTIGAAYRAARPAAGPTKE